MHKLPYVKGDGRTDRQTDGQTDKLKPISLRFTGDNNSILIPNGNSMWNIQYIRSLNDMLLIIYTVAISVAGTGLELLECEKNENSKDSTRTPKKP